MVARALLLEELEALLEDVEGEGVGGDVDLLEFLADGVFLEEGIDDLHV